MTYYETERADREREMKRNESENSDLNALGGNNLNLKDGYPIFFGVMIFLGFLMPPLALLVLTWFLIYQVIVLLTRKR